VNIIKRIVVLVAIGFLVTLTGCKTIIVGDSITWGSQDAIRVALHDDPADNTDLHIDAIIGRGLDSSPMVANSKSMRQVVTELAPLVEEEGVLVIQDGANDMPEGMAPFMQWVNSYVRPDVCIVWVYPYSGVSPYQDVVIRQIIDQYRGGHRHVTMDWHALASVDPGLLVPDGVHPSNPVGTAAFAQLLADTVEGCA
jgi:lysophospholipase L1-like esterase